MTVFERYAPFYDLLYQDKDYSGEADFVAARLRDHGVSSGRLLDLGCGTGVHAIEFARRAWEVAGVDLSEEMIAKARQRAAKEGARASFRQGDACRQGPERDCDAVVSLFHVASYQLDRDRLGALFATAHAALKTGGIFLFDYWYGGAVLAQGVETRVKVVERPPLRVTRIAQSDHDESAATVRVNYTVFCEDMASSTIERIDELHVMRYWFPFEVEAVLRARGFEPLGHYAWLGTELPNSRTWGAYSVARKSAVP